LAIHATIAATADNSQLLAK